MHVNQQHHESLLVVQQHQNEIAQSFRKANHARSQRPDMERVRQISLRLPRWRIRLIVEPARSVRRYNSVSQSL